MSATIAGGVREDMRGMVVRMDWDVRRDGTVRMGWMPRLTALSALAALVWLAGCGTPATPQTYSLLPAAGALAPEAQRSADATPLPVDVEALVLPAAVDQPQWLLRLPDQRLLLLEQTQWVSPLGDELRAALRDSLARRWATTAAQPPAWRLRLALTRFESALGGQALWEGHWTLRPGSAPAAAGAAAIDCALRIREPAGPGLPALAEAHRRAMLRLADQIGPLLRLPPSASPPACPALDG
jgi:hypothetical protein